MIVSSKRNAHSKMRATPTRNVHFFFIVSSSRNILFLRMHVSSRRNAPFFDNEMLLFGGTPMAVSSGQNGRSRKLTISSRRNEWFSKGASNLACFPLLVSKTIANSRKPKTTSQNFARAPKNQTEPIGRGRNCDRGPKKQKTIFQKLWGGC